MNYHIYIDEDVKEQAALAVAQGRMLNLKNDIVFKSFFSKDCAESAYCRKRMLSAVIGRNVVQTTVFNPEILPTRTDGKYPKFASPSLATRTSRVSDLLRKSKTRNNSFSLQ